MAYGRETKDNVDGVRWTHFNLATIISIIIYKIKFFKIIS